MITLPFFFSTPLMILLKFSTAFLLKKVKNFSRSKKMEEAKSMKFSSKKKFSLLKERSLLKEEIQNIPDEGWKLEKVKEDLATVSKKLANLRKTQWQDTQHRLNDEIHEAWNRRDMKSAYKLLRQLAGSKFDVKNETGDS